ncbi:glycosyl transferase [Microbacterium paludicola]|uniref:glycosyl transferase n=1 Tax=Microbacterium paludicola TaxID=300019 RepID=UPI0011A85807|nr:glycosyl transferase [Microbacterium paludicola]
MRFVWAVVAFVLATLLIGAGIAQRTIFMGPSVQQMELSVEEPTPFVLVDGAVLRENPGQQTLLIRDEGDIFAAYGRTADMQAWLADATYTAIDLDDEGAPVSTVVEPTVVAGEEDGADADAAEGSTDADAEEPGRNPEGSDLWLDSFVEQDQMITDMQLPEGMSVLIAKDGTEPAPSDIVVSWPLNTSTPWVGPLITAGGAVLLFGLVMYVLAIRHQRRGRGPRRKGPGPLPATEPIDLAVDSATIREALPPKEAQDPAATEPETPESAEEPTVQKPEKAEHRAAPMRRRLLVLPALGLAGLLFAGCSSDSWPQFGEATPTPTPTPTVITPENQKPPAVTEAQASRILQDISATLEEADAAMDIDLAATRLEGLALDARKTDYALRKSLTDRPLPAVIPTDAIEVLLPQATDAWPRTVLVLSKSKSDDTAPPVILTMTQADPWSDYKVTDIAEMQASTEVPQLAPAWLGTSVITENAAAFLTLAPDEIAAAFADVVDSGEESEYYSAFDPVTIALAESIISSRDAVTQALVDNGAAETSSASFDIEPTDQPPVALATLDSGAIVAVSLVDSESITPTSDDAVIRFGDNAEAKTLTGAEEASKGVVTTYGLQLFFSVPSQGSTEQIRLLAVHQDILNVEVIK